MEQCEKKTCLKVKKKEEEREIEIMSRREG